MPNFLLKTIDLWKKIEKQALTRQIDIIEIEINIANIHILFQMFIQSISVIRAPKPILTSSRFLNLLPL